MFLLRLTDKESLSLKLEYFSRCRSGIPATCSIASSNRRCKLMGGAVDDKAHLNVSRY